MIDTTEWYGENVRYFGQNLSTEWMVQNGVYVQYAACYSGQGSSWTEQADAPGGEELHSTPLVFVEFVDGNNVQHVMMLAHETAVHLMTRIGAACTVIEENVVRSMLADEDGPCPGCGGAH